MIGQLGTRNAAQGASALVGLRYNSDLRLAVGFRPLSPARKTAPDERAHPFECAPVIYAACTMNPAQSSSMREMLPSAPAQLSCSAAS